MKFAIFHVVVSGLDDVSIYGKRGHQTTQANTLTFACEGKTFCLKTSGASPMLVNNGDRLLVVCREPNKNGIRRVLWAKNLSTGTMVFSSVGRIFVGTLGYVLLGLVLSPIIIGIPLALYGLVDLTRFMIAREGLSACHQAMAKIDATTDIDVIQTLIQAANDVAGGV